MTVQVTLNGVTVEPPASKDNDVGYRWLVRFAGFNPYAEPKPVLTYSLPTGETGTVGFNEFAPVVDGATYTVTV